MKHLVLASFLAIFLFHMAAVSFGLYYLLPWLDIPMHLAGGAWVALLAFYILSERWAIFPAEGSVNRIAFFLAVLGSVALVGVLWEFYEYLYDVLIAERHGFLKTQQGVSDTMGDLVNDLLGGVTLAAVFFASRRREVVSPVAVPDAGQYDEKDLASDFGSNN